MSSLTLAPLVFLLLSCLVGFVIGGIPFGYLAGRLVLRDDIRNFGSGNIGATNVGRVLGWNWGGVVLILDALKGLVPTLAAADAASDVLSTEWVNHVAVAAGMSSIAGHMYPIYLRLRGGKGVATALGVVIVLAPTAVVIALPVFVAVLILSRRMALASMLASVTFGAAYLLLAGETAWTTPAASLTVFSVCVPLLIIWRHRSNIRRMIDGTEPALTDKVHSSCSDNESCAADDSTRANDV
jgi:glycerol-3-phosphate acyltransferase PlsY